MKPDAPSVVEPAYGSGALTEVLPATLAALGHAGWENRLDLPPAESYVVVLVDGLGWNLLRSHADVAQYLGGLAANGRAITAGVPSTTATSLTSVGTGLPAGGHGLVGFTSRIPGTGRLLDALRWDSRVDPVQWQPRPTVFERAAEQGITATVVSKRMFEHSGLTRCGQRGADYVGADLQGERIAATVSSASRPGSLTFAYVSELDSTGHRHGCRSADWRFELACIDFWASTLRATLPPTAALVVVADHGMVDVAAANRVDVDDEPDLLRDVAIFGGEARFRHLYCQPGRARAVAGRWTDRLGDAAIVLTQDEAIARGWFGEVADFVRPRLGDVVVASLADLAVISTSRFGHEATLVGLHGSVTADEMLVPLLVDAAG